MHEVAVGLRREVLGRGWGLWLGFHSGFLAGYRKYVNVWLGGRGLGGILIRTGMMGEAPGHPASCWGTPITVRRSCGWLDQWQPWVGSGLAAGSE